eukprot:TRINITY_DN104501_c0_g1_i1.p3 TRINITY_DN104501_c0_g1~~TRINITY_DN104501_c0_g1_i1.p3  ORF type:complete len:125 (+),score=9.42 TRINITY_DN104501_c0_g1_i1:72-446(+)
MAFRAVFVLMAGCSLVAATPTRSKRIKLRRSKANCCDKCPGRLCSPDTGACYGSKPQAKSDYLQCPGVPDVACCDRCSGQFCSPVSGACYRSQTKDYYEFCPAVSAETSPTSPAEEALWPYVQV